MLPHDVPSGGHQHAEGRRRAVPDGDLMLGDGGVPIPGAEASAHNDVGHAVQPRRKDAVGGAGHPARVGRAPIDVVLLHVKHPAARHQMADHGVLHVQHAFRLAGGAGRVVHDKRVFERQPFDLGLLVGLLHLRVVAVLAGRQPFALASDEDDVLERGQVLHRHAAQ